MTEIALEPSRPLAPQSEIALLRAALARADSRAMRLRLARLYNDTDAFAETVALLAPHATAAPERLALFNARRALGDHAGAAADARHALDLAKDTPTRVRAQVSLASALLDLDREGEALPLLEAALATDRGNVAAFKRLAVRDLRAGDFAGALARCDAAAARGVHHSRLLAARTLALAGLGRSDDARGVVDLPGRLQAQALATPPHWANAAAFESALTAEILGNPGLRLGRHGTASLRSWRVDTPATGSTPAVRALLAAIAAEVTRYAAARADAPPRAELRSWCVITEGEGEERWHMHPHGWLSGGYYVTVPSAVASGDGPAGCIGFGLPGGMIGAAAAAEFGETLVRPRAGLLTLFPSHAYHRTWPHRAAGKRICLAFDICPV